MLGALCGRLWGQMLRELREVLQSQCKIWGAGRQSFAVVLSVMSLLWWPPVALSQEKAEAAPAKTTYNFEDDLVTGDLVRPDGELLRVRRRGRQSSLIRIRETFVPEMLESVEDL